MARQLRRAQAVARLRHPNLVRLLPLPGGAGLSPVLGNAHRLADFTLPAGTFKRFDLEQVVRLLLDVLSGLAALHEVVTDGQGFVHGQVSPQTIYIDEHGTARLVPLLNGTKLDDAGYTAPERVAGGAIDARADVFSVGVMLWEALAGKRLYPDGFAERLPGALPAPIRLTPHTRWAQPLCALAERAIELEPSARFPSARELSLAIAAAAAQQLSHVDSDAWQEEAPTPVFQPRLHLASLRTTSPPPAVLTIAPPEPAASAPSALGERAEPAPARSRGARVAAGLGLLALGAVALLLARSPGSWRRAVAASQLAPVAAAPRLPAVTPAAMIPAAETPAAVVTPAAAATTAASVDAPAAEAEKALPPPLPSATPRPSASAVAPAAPPARRPTRPRVPTRDYGI